ncbi:hypothetical protein [Croceibacterium ferulae]|uniref:hypothetical protein n=1 Tax=Croceibacterium ferulae TaxID=1854641 RepID=UPI000EAFA3A1|nr:hypothetical protein [Croceibacterium ferulae]
MWCHVPFSEWETPRRQLLSWLIVAVCSFVVISAVMWFGGFIGVPVAMLAACGLTLAWVVLFVVSLNAAWDCRQDLGKSLLASVAPLGAFGLAVALALPVMWATAWVFDWTFVLRNHSSFQEIVRVAEAGRFDGSAGGYQEYKGTTFLIDEGPPKRVAFLKPGGFLDNWSGIVYDPTGDVMLADGWIATGQFVAPERITKLFDGDLVSCRPLLKNFYNCSFT